MGLFAEESERRARARSERGERVTADGDRRRAPRTAPTAGRPRDAPHGDVKLERFEGPLDLLLHLIKRDEIDIYDIPIAHITQQYLAYLELMRALDLEVAGEFLVMAATLMRIKAKMLLPLPAVERGGGGGRSARGAGAAPDRVPPVQGGGRARSSCARRSGAGCFERGMVPSEDEAGPLPLAPATLFDLLDALNRVLARVPETAGLRGRGRGLRRRGQDGADRRGARRARRGARSRTLLLRCRARAEMIVTFIALLELIKLGQALVIQSETFGDISIRRPTSRKEAMPDATARISSAAVEALLFSSDQPLPLSC